MAWIGYVWCTDEVREPRQIRAEDIAAVVVAVMEVDRLGAIVLLNILKSVRDGR